MEEKHYTTLENPFLFALERERKEAAMECVEIIYQHNYDTRHVAEAIRVIKEKFGLES